MDAFALAVIIALLGAIVAMVIYFLSLHREVQGIKNKEEVALRKIEDVRRELSQQLIEIAKSQKAKAEKTDREVDRCKEDIAALAAKVRQIPPPVPPPPPPPKPSRNFDPNE